jgi:hypothetical protein
MGLFDAFSTRDNSSRNETTVIQDSYNATSSTSNVYDNLGNVSLTIGKSDPVDWAKLAPLMAVGAVVVGMGVLIFMKGKR